MVSQFGGYQSSWKQWLAGCAAAAIFVHSSIDKVWTIRAYRDRLDTGLFIVTDVPLVIIGAFIGAVLADSFGRKRTLLVTLIFVILRLLLSVISLHDDWMRIIEFFIELESGITCVVVPLYISEIASDKNRGNLMVLQRLAHEIGLVISVGIFLLPQYTSFGMTGLTAVASGIILAVSVLFHAITLAILPETPHYLNSKNRYQEAGKSLAFFRGINHLSVEKGATELSPNTQRNDRRRGCCGKVGELMQFENRRSLAMIFSLIVINWVGGQYGNSFRIRMWIDRWDDSVPPWIGVTVIKLIFIIFTTFTIGFFKRKIPLLSVILVCLIATVSGLPSYNLNHWVVIVLTLIECLGHVILASVTLAYAGEFFSINVRAMAIAVVISFEVLMRNIVLLTEYGASSYHGYGNPMSPQMICAGATFFIALVFIMIFFPKTNKTSNFEIAIDTSARKAII